MSVNVNTRCKFNDLQTIILENEYLKLIILPEAGGKIFSIYDKNKQVELLWQNSQVIPQKLGGSACFDDQWAGGWDIIFPNDLAVVFKGITLPDHGELWNMEWDFSVSKWTEEEIIVRLETFAPINRVYVKQEFVLKESAKDFTINYTIRNTGNEEVEYFYRLHPALMVEAGSVLYIPGGIVYCDKEFNSPACCHNSYQWPLMPVTDDELRDMSKIPSPHVQETVFQYIHIREGWFAMYHPVRQTGIKMEFDKKFFPYITYFASFGGWREHYVAVVEPSTGYPADLEQASKDGRTNKLEAYGTIHFTNKVSLIRMGLIPRSLLR